MTWEQWHVFHSEQNDLYTLYINLPERKVSQNTIQSITQLSTMATLGACK